MLLFYLNINHLKNFLRLNFFILLVQNNIATPTENTQTSKRGM